ncbi:hypothetical protein INR76_00420 [Marixanthomonas sp. SCSIO 43207]|uniref:hypothetical protein n=1 Tax=Marixanthomonas sp. SCSIO 43207 TaxID=2779360 RepID=UPI001CA939C2|nr:hypothetical protein [Marixanthomonas sp. SCSIO 43207]UAB81256.1 hypothetical protein INR76_00420 [Marixanthomonas sp. SCSIO 43207]
MAQDIRKMFENTPEEATTPPQGHQARFEARLDQAFGASKPKQNQPAIKFMWLKVAAIAIVFLSIGFFGYEQLSKTNTPVDVVEVPKQTQNTNQNVAKITLGDLSPDLQKVEDYYLTGINVQLASLKIKDDNKELVDGYMQQLSELDKEYQRLTLDLNEIGPTEATIGALIDNLQLRLELLFKLKNKLKELKNQKDETTAII